MSELRPTLLRWTIRFAVATWLAAAALVLIFALFWRMMYAPPHGVWALLTTGAVALMGAVTVAAGIRQFVRGRRRTMTAAIVLLGTTPIVWFAMFVLSLFLQAQFRQPIQLSIPTRITGFWAASVGDLEARWRYPRWTHGQHVILLDDGQTPEPTRLVAEMDQHIEEMAARLHAPVPAGHARWVRGSLLWQHGRALVTWAICDADQNSPELSYLDRHEMAHVTITMMGSVDQEPPMLLAEGWAESQSKDREDMILALAAARDNGTHYSLQELVEPAWYGRPDGPAYHHGGPLVVYFLEHYGPTKFLDLYHGVRPATFAADCERILGDTWPAVEHQFWQWLASEAARLTAADEDELRKRSQTAEDVELAPSVDPADWQAIVAGYRAAWAKRSPMPEKCAFALERIATRPRKADGPEQEPATHKEHMQWVFDGDHVWRITSRHPDGSVEYLVRETGSAILYGEMADGRISQLDMRASGDPYLSDAHGSWRDVVGAADLGHYLPLDSTRQFKPITRIDAIRPPAPPNDMFWEIDYVQRWPDLNGEVTYQMQVDAAADWCVVSERHSSTGENSEHHSKLGTISGCAAAIETSSRTKNEQGEWTVRLRLRELSEAEAQTVRDQVEAIAHRGPTRDWYEPLLRPWAFALAWPSVGVLLVAVGVGRCRRNVEAA